ncbi:hypothetical protein ACP275_13G057400 [Erythranthe tilingii]
MVQKSAVKRKRKSKTGPDIMQLDADDIKKLGQTVRQEKTWTRQFRGGLCKTVTFFRDMPLRQPHLDCLRKTPFYHFVMSFLRRQITRKSVRGTQSGTAALLMTYDKENKCFNLGGKELVITPEECDLIFGITSGSMEVDRKRANRSASP